MVISLAAGVAVPVITIGIPIYMGRKVLAGGSGVPVEPDSPRPWTDPQHISVPPLITLSTSCVTPVSPQSLLFGIFSCPQQPLPARGVGSEGIKEGGF